MDPEVQVRLESSIAHLEKLTEELNEVVIQQGRKLERLAQALERLEAHVKDPEWNDASGPQPPPPHYHAR